MAMLLICPLIQKTFFLIIAGFTIRILASTGLLQLPGHLQALGLHQDPGGKIKEVHGFLEPGEFFDEFVKKSTAVLFKRSCVEFKAFEMWTDEFLREEYGELEVNVDGVKVENRYLSAERMKIKDFVDSYKNNSLYMVDTLPKKMWNDLLVPLSISCGGYMERLQDIAIWFSSQGSKSHLHLDTVDNINCMINGRKKWFLVDLENSKKIVMDHEEGDYCSVNVDQVDMLKYPFLRKIPWYSAVVEEGDCIYIPNGWAHQVSSTAHRNIAVNFWWTPMMLLNKTDCTDGRSKSMMDISFTPAEQYRFQLLQLLSSSKQPCDFQNVHSNVVSEHTGRKIISKEDFGVMDMNHNGLVEAEEIQQLSADKLERIFDGEEPGTINIKGKFHSSTSDEQRNEKDEL